MTDHAAASREQATDDTERTYATHWRHTHDAIADARDGDLLVALVNYARGLYHLKWAVLWAVVALLWLPLELAWTLACYLWEQANGWLDNLLGYGDQLRLEDVLPPSVLSTLRWGADIVPKAFGAGTPYEQVTASVVLIAVTSAASAVPIPGVQVLFVLNLIWLGLGLYALFVRTTPDGDRLHHAMTDPIFDRLPYMGGDD